MDCEINPLKLPRLDKTALALEMGELLGRELELPQVRTVGGHAYLSWQERAVYTVDWGSSQLTETGSKITGDAYRSLTTDTGRFVLDPVGRHGHRRQCRSGQCHDLRPAPAAAGGRGGL